MKIIPPSAVRRWMLLTTAFAMAAAVVAEFHPAAASTRVKIILVGDSTVTDSAGWGLGFKQFLTDGAECINTAQGGRSSESFRREGRWTNALALKGDYYLIQFGHNNEPGKPGRSTDTPTFVSNMVSYVERLCENARWISGWRSAGVIFLGRWVGPARSSRERADGVPGDPDGYSDWNGRFRLRKLRRRVF